MFQISAKKISPEKDKMSINLSSESSKEQKSKHWQFGYTVVPNSFLINKDLDPYEKILFQIIQSFDYVDGGKKLSFNYLSKISGFSRRKVIYALSTLERLGYVKILKTSKDDKLHDINIVIAQKAFRIKEEVIENTDNDEGGSAQYAPGGSAQYAPGGSAQYAPKELTIKKTNYKKKEENPLTPLKGEDGSSKVLPLENNQKVQEAEVIDDYVFEWNNWVDKYRATHTNKIPKIKSPERFNKPLVKFKQRFNLEVFLSFLERLLASDCSFYRGQSTTQKSGWVITLDWILKHPDKIEEILEKPNPDLVDNTQIKKIADDPEAKARYQRGVEQKERLEKKLVEAGILKK